MKKLLVIAAIVATTLFSCTNVTETISEKETANEASLYTYNELLYSINNVNGKYQICNQVKRVKPATVNKWGGKILSAVVDGIGGYISGPAGWLVAPLCSWAFDAHWERCNRDPHTPSRPRRIVRNDNIQVPTYIPNAENPARIDSIGYYHNLVLEKLSETQHDYYNNDSTVNYGLIYEDCKNASSELNIDIPEDKEKEKLISLSKVIVESIADCNGEEDLQKAFEKINSYYNSVFSADENITITEQVQEKIISVLNEMSDESDIRKYADEIYNAIYSSNASQESKDKASVANNVTVNSKLYWESANQKRQSSFE